MFEYEPGFSLKLQGLKKFEKKDITGAIENFSEYLENYNHVNKTALLNRGFCYMKTGEMEKALKDF